MRLEEYENQNHNISVGPWGGQDGARWDDGLNCSVRQVVISHGAAIDSIQVKYEERGCSFWSDRHGGTGGCKKDKIKLDFPQEFLMSISGYYGCLTHLGCILVRSLSLESNLKKYGPFGTQDGTQFSFPVTCAKIVGFHGRCSWHLDSIGFYLKPLQPLQLQNPAKLSLSPLRPNIDAQETVQKSYDMVLTVREKDELNHKHASGEVRWPVKYGPCGGDHGDHGGMSFPIFKTKTEQHASGEVRWPVKYGPCGGDHGGDLGGMSFDDGVFTGVQEVHLTCNGGVVSIKVYYDRNGQAICGNWNGGKAALTIDKVIIPAVVGIYGEVSKRWGGEGGKPWDDGSFTGVKQIILTEGDPICAIEIEYDMNGQSIWSTRHGGGGGYNTHKIKFKYPHEVLTRITGYYGPILADACAKVINSLTFFTNRASYGPFGEEIGTYFSSTAEGKVVGFHGRSGSYLDAIGVHMQQISGDGGCVKAVLAQQNLLTHDLNSI
ncbi:hypothetical protein NE237_016457 [Protea cynaroides]|uniref:Jacalin-type lectin domain-containing protein n=1 Tax=Protea cynaroides TaxID=273540 RepID=A0A9Q0K718_9MAGN|nr:hypothetical protein NE237_016457 [Protea cynaroides]